MKNCNRTLQEWHRKTFKNAEVEIRRLKLVIEDRMRGDNNNVNWTEIKNLQGEIDKLWKQGEIFWGQCSRVKWLQWGDRNSSFFHATTIQRRDRNKVLKIKMGLDIGWRGWIIFCLL